jgi:hypothetical protein
MIHSRIVPWILLTSTSAAQAWNRSDSRAAKALSLRGQSENNLMREAHREAARILYEERNKDTDSSIELYVDLHGKCSNVIDEQGMILISSQVYIQMNQYHISKASCSSTAPPHVPSTLSPGRVITLRTAKTKWAKQSAVSSMSGDMPSASSPSLVIVTTLVAYSVSIPAATTRVLLSGRRILIVRLRTPRKTPRFGS